MRSHSFHCPSSSSNNQVIINIHSREVSHQITAISTQYFNKLVGLTTIQFMERRELVNLTCHVLSCHISRSSLTDSFPCEFWARFFAASRELLGQAPTLLRLSGDFVVVGDLHGNLDDLVRIFQRYRYPPSTKYVFLGDYVDRGGFSIETLVLLFTLQQLYPDHVFLLKGNHETREMTKAYGFRAECEHRLGESVYNIICSCFDALPVCCVLNSRVFCVHGGVSQSAPDTNTLETVSKESDVVSDLIWSDPSDITDRFARSDRRRGHFYSAAALAEFLEKSHLSVMIRAHSYVPRGLQWNFGEDGHCLTIFSSSGYESRNNLAAIALVRAGEDDIRTEIMSPMTPEMLAKRRVLIPSWALAQQRLMKPPMFIPEMCGKLIL